VISDTSKVSGNTEFEPAAVVVPGLGKADEFMDSGDFVSAMFIYEYRWQAGCPGDVYAHLRFATA
jgi:hypothetical protein